jgi:hypothetical protein
LDGGPFCVAENSDPGSSRPVPYQKEATRFLPVSARLFRRRCCIGCCDREVNTDPRSWLGMAMISCGLRQAGRIGTACLDCSRHRRNRCCRRSIRTGGDRPASRQRRSSEIRPTLASAPRSIRTDRTTPWAVELFQLSLRLDGCATGLTACTAPSQRRSDRARRLAPAR